MVKITDLHEALQLVLTKSATEQGEKSGWHQRHGQLSASQFVQTVAFGFLEDPHATLGRLARVAGTLGAAVTPQAISQRFSEKSVALMRGVVMDALGILLESDPVEVDWLQQFHGGVYLNDSTQITWHADWAATWDGGATAALKLPTLLDLLRGSLQVDLVSARQHDSATRLANLDFPPGSVVVEDAGYLDHERMQRRWSQGVHTIVSYRSDLAVFDEQGRRLDVLRWLQQQPGRCVERLVFWQGSWYRFVAIPLSPASAERKRHELRETARTHGRRPTSEGLALAAWHLILTTLPEELASADQIATLTRLRWQIELLFKLWKDQGKLDETRGWKPERIETEFYAKLLGLLIQHWLVLTVGWHWIERSLVKIGQAIRESIRAFCLVWQEREHLASFCTRLTRSSEKTARISSHCHQESTARLVMRA
jgi:Transposase DDE domain